MGQSGDADGCDGASPGKGQELSNSAGDEADYGPKLSWTVKLAYGMGTVITDMTAAAWFTYLLVYLPVAGLSPSGAGHLSDNTRTRFGRRKPWLLGGSVLIGLSFAAVWMECFLCRVTNYDAEWLSIVYFGVMASVFNFGWAAVCVSHMSLVPELTKNPDERVLLNSVRFAFTGVSQLLVYIIALFWIQMEHGDEHAQYRWMAFSILGCGALTMIICLLLVPEKSSVKTSSAISESSSSDDLRERLVHGGEIDCENGTVVQSAKSSSVLSWFRKVKFYQVGMVYMFTRLVVVLGQTTLPFYVKFVQLMPQYAIASMPLIVNIAAIPTTFALKRLGELLGLKIGFTMGGLICMVGFIPMYFIPGGTENIAWIVSVYLGWAVVGIGTACVAVYAMSMEAEVVGNDCSSGAFVYGVYGFLEKLSGGVVIFALEHFKFINKTDGSVATNISSTLFPAVCAALAIVFALTISFTKNPKRKQKFSYVPPPGHEGTDGAGVIGVDENGKPITDKDIYVAQISWASTATSAST